MALNKTSVVTVPATTKDNAHSIDNDIPQDEVTMIVRCSDNLKTSDLGNVLTIELTQGTVWLHGHCFISHLLIPHDLISHHLVLIILHTLQTPPPSLNDLVLMHLLMPLLSTPHTLNPGPVRWSLSRSIFSIPNSHKRFVLPCQCYWY